MKGIEVIVCSIGLKIRYTYKKTLLLVTCNVSNKIEVDWVQINSLSKLAECGFDIGKHGPTSYKL